MPPMVSVGSYCIVFDTGHRGPARRDVPRQALGPRRQPQNRRYTPGCPAHPEFEIDTSIDAKLMISVAPQGYLKRTR